MNTFQSVINLLDNFFGASWTANSVDSLSADELDALAADVDSFYASLAVSPPAPTILRTYSGGATFAANMHARLEHSAGTPIKISHAELLPFPHAATLYADQITVDCPLDAWIYSNRDFLEPRSYRAYSGITVTPTGAASEYGPGFQNSSEEENRVRIKSALVLLETMAPAVRAGWLYLVPHLRIWKRRKHTIEAQLRRDVLNLDLFDAITASYETPPAKSDWIRGLGVMSSDGVIPQDHARAHVESPAIYFNSILAVADSTDSRYLPIADSDYALLQQRWREAGAMNRVLGDSLVIDGLHHVLLPTFEPFDFGTVCEIRRSEASFAAWRDGVRELADGAGLVKPAELSSYRSLVRERVERHVATIRADIAKSATLTGKLRTARLDGLDVGIAAAIWAIPPQASLSKLIAAIAAPLLKRAVLSIVSRSSSPNSVVIRLDRNRRVASSSVSMRG